jgi:phenylacetic acid degradation operon negative regulatory protein
MNDIVKYQNVPFGGRAGDLLRDYRGSADASARVLLVTIFGDSLHPGREPVWISDLLSLTRPFGISERLLRTSLNRLLREGVLSSERQGRRSRYAVHSSAVATFEQAEQRIYSPGNRPWDGRWTLVLSDPGHGTPNDRRRLRRELGWLGFGELSTTSHVSPVLLPEALDILTPEAREGIRFVTRGEPSLPGLDAEALAAVALRSPEPAGHRQVVIDRFSPLRESAGGLDPIDAYLVRTLLVDAHRRVVLRSPELPEALLTDDGIDRRYLQMVAGLYRCLEPASEAFLAEVFPTGEGRVGRFRG